jgi:hypothetical protein
MRYHNCMSPHFGADPEAFLRKDGKIVASHELLEKPNLKWESNSLARDGVQVELQPWCSTCRQTTATHIRDLMLYLQTLATAKKMTVSPDIVVELTQEEYDNLPEEARILGCQPSSNIYGVKPIEVEKDWKIRSAGGHLHFGIVSQEHATSVNKIWWDAGVERQVAIWDMLLGTMSVMLDRSDQSLRRQAYGRAGEYRRQPHGLEYRVLSNFWLRSYTLWSLVTGMARCGMNVNLGEIKEVYDGTSRKRIYQQVNSDLGDSLLALSTPDELQEIINTNSVDKAQALWEKIRGWASKVEALNLDIPYSALSVQSLEVIQRLAEEGLEKYFPANFDDWATHFGRTASQMTPGWELWTSKYLNSYSRSTLVKGAA